MKKKIKLKTPGTYLLQLLDTYDIPTNELIRYALVTRKQLDSIINGTDLIPWSIVQYLKNNYAIPRSRWLIINEAYCVSQNRQYIGIDTGHEMLLNAILFEKDQ